MLLEDIKPGLLSSCVKRQTGQKACITELWQDIVHAVKCYKDAVKPHQEQLQFDSYAQMQLHEPFFAIKLESKHA